MAESYSVKDLERATSLVETHSFMQAVDNSTAPKLVELIAYGFADVRREALEEAALTIEEILIACECGAYHPLSKVAGALRVLKDKP
jgi:hypothetical protein